MFGFGIILQKKYRSERTKLKKNPNGQNALNTTKMKYKTKLAQTKTDKTPIKKKGMITGRYCK